MHVVESLLLGALLFKGSIYRNSHSHTCALPEPLENHWNLQKQLCEGLRTKLSFVFGVTTLHMIPVSRGRSFTRPSAAPGLPSSVMQLPFWRVQVFSSEDLSAF